MSNQNRNNGNFFRRNQGRQGNSGGPPPQQWPQQWDPRGQYDQNVYPPEPQSGRGRGKQGRGPRSNLRPAPSAPPATAAPTAELPQEVPKPAHLSKVPSTERNDPLASEAVFPDAATCMGNGPPVTYAPGFEGLRDIVEQTYAQLRSRGSQFTRVVPLCAYAYYASVLAYGKILKVKERTLALSHGEQEFVRMLGAAELIAPTALSAFIASYGCFRSLTGRDVDVEVIPVEYQTGEITSGYFGMMSETTFQIYRAYPCPAVHMQAVRESIRYTHGRRDNPLGMWDLPQGVRPNDLDAERPNPNLLGWRPAVELSDAQIQFLEDAGITIMPPRSDVPHMCISMELMRRIRGHLAQSTMTCPTIVLGTVGSTAQTILSEPVPDGGFVYSSRIDASVSYQLPANVAYLGTAMRFRMRYPTGTAAGNGMPYGFTGGRVPPAWAAATNRFRELDSVPEHAAYRNRDILTSEIIDTWVRAIA